MLYFTYSLTLSENIEIQDKDIFLVRFAFLSYGLLFLFINLSKHLLQGRIQKIQRDGAEFPTLPPPPPPIHLSGDAAYSIVGAFVMES